MGFNETNIRWTDRTWNPVHGCSKSGSPGCANCYAERVSRKFGNTDRPWLPEHAAANVQLKPEYLSDRVGHPSWVFVNSMSDLFHPRVPDGFVSDAFAAMADMPDSAFQVLTKHGADNERAILHPPDNVMVGVSVGHPELRYRIDWLREQPVATRFVSFEPLVHPIEDVDLSGVDWAIIGGESGPDYREMNPAWARSLVDTCHEQDVPVFFKQHSDRHTEARQTLGGERIEEWPDMPNGVLPRPQKHMQETLV